MSTHELTMDEDEIAVSALATKFPPAFGLVHLPYRVKDPAAAMLDALGDLGLGDLDFFRVDDICGRVRLMPRRTVAEGFEEDAAEVVPDAWGVEKRLRWGMVRKEVSSIGCFVSDDPVLRSGRRWPGLAERTASEGGQRTRVGYGVLVCGHEVRLGNLPAGVSQDDGSRNDRVVC